MPRIEFLNRRGNQNISPFAKGKHPHRKKARSAKKKKENLPRRKTPGVGRCGGKARPEKERKHQARASTRSWKGSLFLLTGDVISTPKREKRYINVKSRGEK